jgi:TPR repeat protein
MHNLGVTLQAKRLMPDSREPFAEKGDAQAQYRLAILNEHGWGTPKDSTRAVGHYKKAANQGLVSAQLRLGGIYLRGTLVLQDLAKARQWFEKAAMAVPSWSSLTSMNADLALPRTTSRPTHGTQWPPQPAIHWPPISETEI